jgi:hypothetical protein
MLNLVTKRVGIFVFVSHHGEKTSLQGRGRAKRQQKMTISNFLTWLRLDSGAFESLANLFNPFFNQPLMSLAPNSSLFLFESFVCRPAIILNICDQTTAECLLMDIDDGNKFPYTMTVCVYFGDYN